MTTADDPTTARVDEEDPRIAKFRAMVDDDADNELAWFSLGQALLDVGRSAEAEVAFGRAGALQPDLMMAWYRRGECLLQLGRYAEAREMALKTRDLAIAQHHEGPKADADEMLEEIDDALA